MAKARIASPFSQAPLAMKRLEMRIGEAPEKDTGDRTRAIVSHNFAHIPKIGFGVQMKFIRSAGFTAACALLSGCGTIIQGPTQQIAFTSDPQGAECDLWKNATSHIASFTTPTTITVRKTKVDMQLTCRKDGYNDGSTTVISGYGLGTFGNAIVGGYGGWAIDSATGSDNKYPSTIHAYLTPLASASTAAKPMTILPPDN